MVAPTHRRLVTEASPLVADTLWRTISSWGADGVVSGQALPANLTPRSGFAGGIYLRRAGCRASMRLLGVTFTGIAQIPLPPGFAPTPHYVIVPYADEQGVTWGRIGATAAHLGTGSSPASPRFLVSPYGSLIEWPLTIAFPTTYPGTPAPA